VTAVVQTFIHESPENTLRNQAGEKAWGEPLVGFWRGDDPLYEEYKKVVGTFPVNPRSQQSEMCNHIQRSRHQAREESLRRCLGFPKMLILL